MLRSNLNHAGRALAAVLLVAVMAFTSVLVAPSSDARASAGKGTAFVAPIGRGDSEALPGATPATIFRGVEVQTTEGGVLAGFDANGKIGVTKVFTMTNPPRLVVDLPGLGSEIAEHQWHIGSPFVERIRMKAHPNKVRVVFDGGEKSDQLVNRRLIPFEGGLMIAIGTGEPLFAALETSLRAGTAAQEKEHEEVSTGPGDSLTTEAPATSSQGSDSPDSETGVLQIYGVNYDAQADKDRIVVLANGAVDYEVHEPDPHTVIVSLRNAAIAPEAEGRLMSQPDSAISLVTVFQQPDVPVSEVRIVVERNPGLKPLITPEGSALLIDFARGKTIADASSRPSIGDDPGVKPSDPKVTEPTLPAANKIDSGFGGTGFEEPADVSRDADELDEEWVRDAEQPILGKPEATSPPAAPDFGSPMDILHEGGLVDGKIYQGRRISLDFNDVPVADVMRLIAEVSDLNVIAGDEVQGNVTIRMMDVPWDQALDVILMTKGLGFVRVGNVLRVAPADVLKGEEELRLQERRNKERLEDLEMKLQPVNYADVGEAARMVENLLTERGSVIQDERTSTLIIKDIPSVVREVVALIRAIDTQTPQVLIEAKIVEANLDFSRELGTTWSIGSQPLNDGFNPNSGARQDLGGKDFRFHDANNITFSNPISAVPTASGALTAFLLDDKLNLDVQIQAQEATGEGKVISSPRIVTLDNRKAEIQQGVSIPFQTFEQGDAKLEFVDAVLSLTVTPHITADKSIIMDLEVTRNAPDSAVATPTGSPAISKNVARTETLVRDGQTLVLGGIYTVTKSESHSRVPYLSRIPVLGGLFKNKRVKDDRKELLIFVTPRIIVPPDTL